MGTRARPGLVNLVEMGNNSAFGFSVVAKSRRLLAIDPGSQYFGPAVGETNREEIKMSLGCQHSKRKDLPLPDIVRSNNIGGLIIGFSPPTNKIKQQKQAMGVKAEESTHSWDLDEEMDKMKMCKGFKMIYFDETGTTKAAVKEVDKNHPNLDKTNEAYKQQLDMESARLSLLRFLKSMENMRMQFAHSIRTCDTLSKKFKKYATIKVEECSDCAAFD